MTKILREGADSVEAITSRTAATHESRSQEAQHTPLPWVQTGLLVRDQDANQIAHCTRWERARPKPEVAEANAAFIVRACNHHEALLAALHRMLDCHQAAMDAAQSNASRFVEKQCDCGACDEARAAIAKAEGE